MAYISVLFFIVFSLLFFFFFFQAEDGIRDSSVTGVQTCALPISWHAARPGVQMKLLAQDDELYVFAESRDRVAKERSMRRRQLKWLWARLQKLSTMSVTRDC